VGCGVDYDDFQWRVYERGRALSPEREELWAGVFGRYLGGCAGATLLDLGSGTGIYSELLAETFGANVVGVEPSARMRTVAKRRHAHPRVRYVEGTAERIPLADGSCDAALLSNVLHHMRDVDAGVRELERVLNPAGLVLLRGSLRGARVPFLDYFPAARPIALAQSPPAGEIVATFTRGGFEHVATERIEQPAAPSFREYCERVGLRAISTLELIDDADFEAGMARMRLEATREEPPRPVVEEVDLVVFRRSSASAATGG
jgi:ubiquinone/menaquinone biosynthesis C-methylase UbiE